MAVRPVFFARDGQVFSRTFDFEWFPGFAVSQKQKSVDSLHRAILDAVPDAVPLEVSTKSREALGVKLSAFRLKLRGRTLESTFQGAKVFQHGGPFPDLLDADPKDAKRDPRLKASGPLTAFRYQGQDFPLEPKTVFYDWLYCAAVRESLSAEDLRTLCRFDCFSDIEFTPGKSLNTQARSAALVRLLLSESGGIPDFTRDGFILYHQKHITD